MGKLINFPGPKSDKVYRLYVWRGPDVLPNWDSGLCVAIATSSSEAREYLLPILHRMYFNVEKGYVEERLKFLYRDPEVFPLTEPVAFAVEGGSI